MYLLAGEDGLFQLIFLLLMLLGWGIKSAAEERQRRRKRREQAERTPVPTAEADGAGEVASPRTSPIPHRGPTTGRPVPHGPERRTARRRDPGPTAVGASHLGSTAERHIDELHTKLEKRLKQRGRAATAPHTHAHARTRAILLGTDGRPSKAQVRAGILWSEVLGPPRALRGPHRAPALDRRVAGRARVRVR